MRHLMSLGSIVHHLLISPLSELCISRVVIWILWVHLVLGGMTVELEGLLRMVLVERGVKLLLGVRWGPSSLLLLHGVWVGLLADLRGGSSVIVGGGRSLSGHCAVDSI